jgi:toxin ParE1/3/4
VTELVISEQARIDLREIADYIARDNPDRAETFIEELLAKMTAICEHPGGYRLRPEWRPDFRSSIHSGYHIIFRLSVDRVEIARVMHGSRDIPNLL